MEKILQLLIDLKTSAKKHFTLKKILERGLLKFFIISWLIVLLIHGGFAVWRTATSPAEKVLPQISFSEFTKLLETGKIEYMHLRYFDFNNDAEVPDFKADQVKMMLRLKGGEEIAVNQINFSQLNYAQLLSQIKDNQIKSIVVLLQRGGLIVSWKENKIILISNFPSFFPDREELSKLLTEKSIPYWELGSQFIGESNFGEKWTFFMLLLPHVFLFLVVISLLNSNIRYEEAVVLQVEISSKTKITFDDVAGIEEAKEEIMEMLDFIRFPEKFIEKGAKLPHGILLVGPPGCGKTLLAKALASVANVPFKSAVGSEFIEMYVGVGAQRIRALFREVKQMARAHDSAAILFIDEIDALGTRADTPEMGEMEMAQTIAQVLHEMDGFEPNEKIFVIGATNRPENLDPAIRRPGRFDRQIFVNLPDLKGREAILEIHCKGKKVDDSLALRKVAELTPPGFSGADLANVANEAAIRTARLGKEKIEMIDFEKSIEKVLLGPERKNSTMDSKDKWRTAYHESGHAAAAKFTIGAAPPEKISIIPTTKGVGGFTRTSQKEEKYYWTKQELSARIKVLFGGRIAEEMIFGKDKISTGAKEDFREATQIAEQMVCDFGMTADLLGPRTFGTVTGNQYLGQTFRRQDYSEEIARAVDEAKKTILTQCYGEIKATLECRRAEIKLLAKTLKKRETLNAEEINQLLKINQRPR